jgi:hypothetical protein
MPAPIYLKFLAGALTGGVGSVIGNPFDVLKTLSQANQGKAVPLMTLVSTMHAEQGMAGFYRGVTANIMRACVLMPPKWYVTTFRRDMSATRRDGHARMSGPVFVPRRWLDSS